MRKTGYEPIQKSRNSAKPIQTINYTPSSYLPATAYTPQQVTRRSKSPASLVVKREPIKTSKSPARRQIVQQPADYTMNIQQLSISKSTHKNMGVPMQSYQYKSPDMRKNGIPIQTRPVQYYEPPQNDNNYEQNQYQAYNMGHYSNPQVIPTKKPKEQMDLDELLQTVSERRRQQYPAPTGYAPSRERLESFGENSESPSTAPVESYNPDMEKVLSATMKLTEEVMEMKKAMEQMQTNILDKDMEIAQLHNNIDDEKTRVFLYIFIIKGRNFTSKQYSKRLFQRASRAKRNSTQTNLSTFFFHLLWEAKVRKIK